MHDPEKSTIPTTVCGFCPNCAKPVSVDVSECPHCGALFGSDSSWAVLDENGSVADGARLPVVSVDSGLELEAEPEPPPPVMTVSLLLSGAQGAVLGAVVMALCVGSLAQVLTSSFTQLECGVLGATYGLVHIAHKAFRPWPAHAFLYGLAISMCGGAAALALSSNPKALDGAILGAVFYVFSRARGFGPSGASKAIGTRLSKR